MFSLDYYKTQSMVTDPGKFSYLYTKLPSDIRSLCKIIQGLLIHETDGKLFKYKIPEVRIKETNLRYVRNMLEKILELDPSDLAEVRDPDKRLVVTCRDFACLLCSMLRAQHIPARVRIGFATYIYHNTDFKSDHALLEYWDYLANKWRRVDARTSEFHIQNKRHIIDFDIYDVPENRFIVAGGAWIKCRQEPTLADCFGYGLLNRVSGWWYIRNKVMQDLAALNKCEPLLWDAWGLMLQQKPGANPTTEQIALLDEVALFTKDNYNFLTEKITHFYRSHDHFKISEKILACSPSLGEHEICLYNNF